MHKVRAVKAFTLESQTRSDSLAARVDQVVKQQGLLDHKMETQLVLLTQLVQTISPQISPLRASTMQPTTHGSPVTHGCGISTASDRQRSAADQMAQTASLQSLTHMHLRKRRTQKHQQQSPSVANVAAAALDGNGGAAAAEAPAAAEGDGDGKTLGSQISGMFSSMLSA